VFKVYGYWTAPRPEDVAAFEDFYMDTHIVTASRVPHLRELRQFRMELPYKRKDQESRPNETPAHYRIVELTFDTRADFEASFDSPEWAAMVEEGRGMRERFGVFNSGDLATGDDFPIWRS
jgi:uncharacterized protein (TIGR02118 family)